MFFREHKRLRYNEICVTRMFTIRSQYMEAYYKMNKIQTIHDEVSPIVAQRIKALRELRKKLIGLDPEDALDLIISCDQPIPLVHSIPAQDLLVLIHEIGYQDALPILSLVSEQQWLYLMDAQIWKRDRMCMTETTRWLYLLLKAEPNRFIQWVLKQEPIFFYFYLYQNLEILALQEDEDFSDLPDSFFTMDNVYYVSVSDYRLSQPLDRETEELREEFILEFFKRLAAYDHMEYQNILINTSAVIPAEYEEESFRLKNVRLESYGFLPFEEAIGLYQPIPGKKIFKANNGYEKTVGNETVNTPQLPIQSIPGDNYFYEILMQEESDAQVSNLHLQFAHLCNQIISADNIIVTSRDILKKVVEKACGYIHIGIEILLDGQAPHSEALKKIALDYPVKHLFQWGYGHVLKIKWKVDAWYRHSFAHNQGLTLSFWGEKWMGLLGGMLLKRPRYYVDFEDGTLYREFKSITEVNHVNEILKQIIAFDEMLSLFSVEMSINTEHQLTLQNMLLTLFARDQLKLSHGLSPIPIRQLKDFYQSMWKLDANGSRTDIHPLFKASFLQWFSKQTRFDIEYLNHRLGDAFEQIFEELYLEMSDISFDDLSSRHVYLFLLSENQ